MAADTKRILIVEDNRIMADVLRFNLERAGFSVTVVGHAADAAELTQSERFDLVLTDYQLPGMNGEELCRCIRSSDPDIPIFLCSAKGFELDVERLVQELNLARVLVKPFSPREVVAAVQAALTAQASTA